MLRKTIAPRKTSMMNFILIKLQAHNVKTATLLQTNLQTYKRRFSKVFRGYISGAWLKMG